MDIQYDDFIVEVIQENIHNKVQFFDNEKDIYINDTIVEIKENVETKIYFYSNNMNAKLFVDGLETLNNKFIEENSYGESYIKPMSEEILLYDSQTFPLIPGYFRVIVEINNVKYFSKIKVNAKFIGEDELEIIKRDLEKVINGLAFELIKRNMSLGDIVIDELPLNLYRFFIIKSKFTNVMAALEDLKIKPNYRISKKYKIVREDEVKCIDEVTIKNYVMGNVEEGFLTEPITVLDYDLPENQWLKEIINEIIGFLEEFIISSNNFIYKKKEFILELNKYNYNGSNANRISNENKSIKYLEQLVNLAYKMKNAMKMLYHLEWFKNVSCRIGINLPHTLFCDSRYSSIYKLHKELRDNNYRVSLDNKLSFQWKRTDKLYEMWCFIKISEILMGEKLNYIVNGGWLFDKKIESNNVLIPELEAGTQIMFKKDDIKLNLTYDQIIPINSIETNNDSMPIYITSRNRRPDGRIDIYKKNVYIGTIILEFKYRDRRNLWNKNYTNFKYDSTVIRQLTSYGDNCSSRYLFKNNEQETSRYKNSIKPVMKVLIFYPKRTDKKDEIDEVEDHNLKFIRFKPNIINNAEESIYLAINELLDRYQEHINR